MKFETTTLDNKLQVLTISDDRFVKSSAALAVQAGSMQNPDQHLGLAHFLEHMLFLGTEDFPQVGEYEDYLNKNGGGHNAYTSIDHTNYFFDVSHSAYEGALKRFSRFFVNPTFDDKYVEREKNAVHSEHEKNIKDDGRREYRFLQMITDPSHPFSKFATGDIKTLAKANRDIVMDFYKSKYSSNLMRLVLMGKEEPKQLIKLANQYFSDIPNIELPTPQYSDQLFIKEGLPKFHQVATVRDQDLLKVSFDMPDDMPYWESKPTQFLAHLIGEEGEGSLLSYLKHQGLALGLETSTWWRMFHVKVNLTDKGKENHLDVLKAIFSFIELVKKEGLKKYIFDERQILAQIELDNIEPKSSMGRASQFSASMLYFPADKFLSQYYLYHKYSTQDFENFMSYLNVDNMQVTLFTKEAQGSQQEPYYGIRYSSDDLDPSLVKELKHPAIYGDFLYPEPNPYIPKNLSLIAKPHMGEPKDELYHKYSRLYSQQDTELEIPKASISLSFVSDAINGDPRKFLLAKLFTKMKKDELNEWGYPARLAGLNFSLVHGYNTMTLDVSGYSEHIPDLMQNLIHDQEHGRQINHAQVDEATFDRIKTRLKKALANKSHDAAYQQLLYEVGQFFSTAAINYKDYLGLIDSISLKEVNDFAKEFFSKVSLRSFSYGNIDGDAVKPVIDKFFDIYKPTGMTEDDVSRFENKYLALPNKKLAMIMTGHNNNNGEITLYKMSDWSIRNQAICDLLCKLIEQPFFTELRTHQQLGYVVAAFPSSSYGYCGLGTLIQSQTHGAGDIFERAAVFMKDILSQMRQSIDANDVQLIKDSVIEHLSQKPNTLSERMARFTTMAGNYHGDFAFFDKYIAEVKKISAADLSQFIAESGVLNSASSHGQLSFLFDAEGETGSVAPQGFEKIEDYQTFRDSVPHIQPYKG